MNIASSIDKIPTLWFAFGYDKATYQTKPQATRLNRFELYRARLLKFFKKYLKKNVKSLTTPQLKHVQIIDYLSFDEKAFARDYVIVQIKDTKTREIKNVYDFQLKYLFQHNTLINQWEGSVYLIEEQGQCS